VEIMDMSFAIQALSLEHLVRHHATLQPKVYNVPEELDQMVARTKLEVMGVRIDELTAEQRKYLLGWQEGT
jgi:adenosylhomocysteinase